MSEYFPAPGTARYEALVTPQWVLAVQDFEARGGGAPRPATYEGERLVVVEVSWAKLEAAVAYQAGHVPGALHLDTDDLEGGYPAWRLRPVEELQAVLGGLGITPGTTVVVYGHQLIAAARAWWVLMYAGAGDVRLMDGGYEAWTAAGLPTQTEIQAPPHVVFSGTPRLDFIATTEYVRARVRDGTAWLADARSEAEFRGEVSGYDYLDGKGRIPSAVHIGDADDKARLYQHADGRLRDPEEIAALWGQAGLRTATRQRAFEREVVFSCGSGWRSSLAFFYAWLLGYGNMRNYSDGWSGWSTAYVKDSAAAGSTPGWRQEPTENPIAGPG